MIKKLKQLAGLIIMMLPFVVVYFIDKYGLNQKFLSVDIVTMFIVVILEYIGFNLIIEN